MTFVARYRTDLNAVPAAARGEICRVMDQVAEAVDTLPGSNPFWASARDSVLLIDVAGFRVSYRLDLQREQVVVVEIAPLTLKSGR